MDDKTIFKKLNFIETVLSRDDFYSKPLHLYQNSRLCILDSMDIGYSSHGIYDTLDNILELELDRGNEHIIFQTYLYLKYINRGYKNIKNKSVIWISTNPLIALRYGIDADMYNKSDEELQIMYP